MHHFITVIILFVLPNINQANQPFDPNSGTHTHYIKHKFYDLHFFEYNETILNPIKLTNNPNAIIQQNVTNADDSYAIHHISFQPPLPYTQIAPQMNSPRSTHQSELGFQILRSCA